MKGGVASMISAAEAIRKSGVGLKGDIVVACVVGELQGGVGTVHALESGVTADMAIVAEPFGSRTIMTTHAGVIGMAINTLGYSTHITVTGAGDRRHSEDDEGNRCGGQGRTQAHAPLRAAGSAAYQLRGNHRGAGAGARPEGPQLR